jgi:hypothetical protein
MDVVTFCSYVTAEVANRTGELRLTYSIERPVHVTQPTWTRKSAK